MCVRERERCVTFPLVKTWSCSRTAPLAPPPPAPGNDTTLSHAETTWLALKLGPCCSTSRRSPRASLHRVIAVVAIFRTSPPPSLDPLLATVSRLETPPQRLCVPNPMAAGTAVSAKAARRPLEFSPDKNALYFPPREHEPSL